jgi:hypothetical protein
MQRISDLASSNRIYLARKLTVNNLALVCAKPLGQSLWNLELSEERIVKTITDSILIPDLIQAMDIVTLYKNTNRIQRTTLKLSNLNVVMLCQARYPRTQ